MLHRFAGRLRILGKISAVSSKRGNQFGDPIAERPEGEIAGVVIRLAELIQLVGQAVQLARERRFDDQQFAIVDDVLIGIRIGDKMLVGPFNRGESLYPAAGRSSGHS